MIATARPAVEQAAADNKGVDMRMFLIVTVAVIVGLALGYGVMNMFYSASAPAPSTMKK
jgi:hypothetical protein